MVKVKCELPYHGRLWPHAAEGDVKEFTNEEYAQLMSDRPRGFALIIELNHPKEDSGTGTPETPEVTSETPAVEAPAPVEPPPVVDLPAEPAPNKVSRGRKGNR